MLPQVGLGTGVEKGREQVHAEDASHLGLDLGREVVAAQVVEVIQIAVDLSCIGQRAVDIVKVTYDELSPVDEFVELLGNVAHGAAIGIIEGKYHLDVAGDGGIGQLGHELVDGCHTRHQVGFHRCGAPVSGNEFLLQVVCEELSAAAVGEHEAIVFKPLDIKVMTCDLLQKGIHGVSVFSCQFSVFSCQLASDQD